MDWTTLGIGLGHVTCCGMLILILPAVWILTANKSHVLGHQRADERGVRWDDPTETFAKFVERNQDVFYEE